MQGGESDVIRILRAMKVRYRTQAMQNLGFYLLQTRPIIFFIAAIFFLCGGHRHLRMSQRSVSHQVRLDALGVVVQQRGEHLL
jgi:hypothetical protein